MWKIISLVTSFLLEYWKRRRKEYEEENGRLLRRRRLLILRLIRNRRHKNVVKTCWAYPKTGRYWEETVPTYSDTNFLKHFRMSRETFQFIVDELYPNLMREDTIMRRAIPVDKRIAVALTVLKSSCDFLSVAKLFGIGKSTVHLILKEFSSAVCSTLYDKIVTFSLSVEKRNEIADGFQDTWHFPGCIGGLSALHIPILSPSQSSDAYVNCQGYHSIVLLGIVDHQHIFRYADVGQPGGTEDTSIFLKSDLYKQVCAKPIPKEFHLIAGLSFPTQQWLMTPFPTNTIKDDQQKRFDSYLLRATTPATVAFTHLRGRWKILLKRCDLKIDNMIDIVKTCLVLHNLCESNGDPYFDLWNNSVTEEERNFPQPSTTECVTSISTEAIVKRNELTLLLQ